MQDLKIALVQTDIEWENTEKNLRRLDHTLSSLDEKQDIIVLPEMFSIGFTMDVEKCSETMDGPSLSFMRRKSKELGCAITGSVLIREDNHHYNRMFWAMPDNSLEFYNKRHLFSMGGEHMRMTSGKSGKVVTYMGWRINLQICYDLRFPVWCKNTYREGEYGYDLLICIANWPSIRREAYLKLLPARAIENISYVVWVNRTGKDGKGILHSGDCMAIAPEGRIVNAVRNDKETVLSVLLSHSELSAFRESFQVGPDWDGFKIKE